jgi:ADP-heptose:LPS heptosyltransferase
MSAIMQEKPEILIGLSLDRLTALISLLGLLVCNNSGPLHIACAVKTPTVSTMGPTEPELWWPAGEENVVIRRELPCSPCGKAVCASHDCMNLISVDEMLNAVSLQIKRLSKK